MDDLAAEFVTEASAQLDAAEAAIFAGDSMGSDEAARRLHSLRGAAGRLSFTRIEALAHIAESLLARGPPARPFLLRAIMRIRDVLIALEAQGAEPRGNDADLVSAAEQDRLPSLADTLAHARDRLLEISPGLRDPRLNALLSRLNALGVELEDARRTRPIADCYAVLPGLVENAARQQGKRIKLHLGGALDIELDAVSPLKEALTHLVRNACLHGIETPEARRAAGKPATGRINVSAQRGQDCAIIEVSDDGRGFDIPALRRRAMMKGVLPREELLRMPEADVARLAFAPGISSAVEITLLGRRGAGLDAARAAVARLGGELTISANAGPGAAFVILIPDVCEHYAPAGVGVRAIDRQPKRARSL